LSPLFPYTTLFRSHGVAVLSIEGENAADSTDNPVAVAKEIEHREDHHEEIEDKLRDVPKNGAEALREKTGLLLNCLLHGLRGVGVRVQSGHVWPDTRRLFRDRRRRL